MTESTIDRLDFRVLGSLRVLRAGVELPLGGQKQRAVLAVLLLQPGRALSTDGIAEAVWNNDPPATSTSIVQVYVSALRRILSPPGSDPHSYIQTVAPGYRLVVPAADYDLARFEQARADGERARADGQPEPAGWAFRQALAQWSGPALADLRGLRFADDFADAVAEQRLQTLQARIDADLAGGRQAELVGELVTLTHEQPLREGFWAQLIVALYRCGRQGEALAAYRTLRATLQQELGLDPSPPLRQLEQAILRQEDLPDAFGRPSRAPVPAPLDRTLADDHSDGPRASLRRADGTLVEISAGGLRLGRAPDSDLVVDDPKASRQHAVIVWTASGFVLSDLHSRNGTQVANSRVSESRLLEHGDVIKIGDTVLVFAMSEP